MDLRSNPVADRMMRPSPSGQVTCPDCGGVGYFPIHQRPGDARSCKPCKGSGLVKVALLILLLLVIGFATNAATVTGTIRNRQGAVVSTNINFKAVQRPLFDATPSVLPGWTLTTNSAGDGTFSTPLLAGNYQVTVGAESRDSFLIQVPTNNASYEITTLITNLASYTYTGGQTFTGFVAQINGLTVPVQTFAVNTNVSTPSITSAGSVHTFNLPPGGGGGSSITTNGNQFLGTPLAIKDGARQTNTAFYGSTIEFFGTDIHYTGIFAPYLTANTAMVVGPSLSVESHATVSTTELGWLDGVTAPIQTALDNLVGATNGLNTRANNLQGATNGLRTDVLNLQGVTNGLSSRQGGSALLTNFIAMGITNIVSANANTVITTNAGVLTLTTTSGGGGEANVNGESSVTNAALIGLVNGKAGVTNLLRSISGGNGIVLTNNGTNIPIAIDPAVVASQANLTAASNAVVSYANGVTNASIVRQTELTGASNAVVSYANGVTNASIVRQTELTAASNVLATATAGKQQGSFILTNFIAMGITNIVSANANTVITTNAGVLTLTTASGGGTTNPVTLGTGSLFLTNSTSFTVTNAATLTNATQNVDWNGNQLTRIFLSGPVTANVTNAPAPGSAGRTIEIEVIHTGIAGSALTVQTIAPAAQAIDWIGGLRIAENATNRLTLKFDGTNTLGYSSHTITISRKSSASVVEIDATAAKNWTITNRVSAASSVIITNTVDGDEISVTLIGEASGGSARVITLIPQLGHLVADLDTFGTALATSTSFTLTNGNAAEINWKVQRLNGTNTAAKVIRQYAF